MELLRTLRAQLINRVGSVPVVGPLLREYARRFPEGSVVTIGSGFAAGLRWKRHHRYVNGYWIGNYEYPIQQALARLLAPGDVFYDLGANAGFFSLLAAKLVGPTGQVYAFEPLPENIASVEDQIAENGFSHIELVRSAVGAAPGTAEFSFDPGSNSVAHLGSALHGKERTLKVDVTTLDLFVASHRAPTLLKIDVEGAETEVLAGASAVLEKRPKLLIELHGRHKAEAVSAVLLERGYALFKLDGSPALNPEGEGHIVAEPLR